MTHAALHDAVARRALASVERVCDADLDPRSFAGEVVLRARPVLGADAYAFCLTDPHSGAMLDAVASGLSQDAGRAFVERVYPTEGAAIANQARHDRLVHRLDACLPYESLDARFLSSACWAWMRTSGVARDLRSVLSAGGAVWGFWCTMRSGGERAFGEREQSFARRVQPRVARALHRAAAATMARTALTSLSAPATSEDLGENARGVVAIDGAGALTLVNRAATAHLVDVRYDDVAGPIPTPVLSVVGMVRAGSVVAQLYATGRSGLMYRVWASRAASADVADAAVVVVTEIVRGAELARVRAQLYRLTSREMEVAELVSRGLSTRDVARRLAISEYTVQEHLGRACTKAGVRGRRELVARLFLGADA